MQAPAPYGVPQAPTQQPSQLKRYDGKNGAPLYDSNNGGHYGASAALSAQGHAPSPDTFQGHWQNVSEKAIGFVGEKSADEKNRYRKV